MTSVDHMVIIPCHGIWKGGATKGDSQSEWYLAPFQLEGDDHLSMKQHILKSIEIIKSDANAIVIISGGKTKPEVNESEASSYFKLFQQLTEHHHDKVLLEEYARDSFENVIFSICRFYEAFHTYPKRVTVIGFEFKRSRFLKNHFSDGLGFNIDNVQYIGNSPNPKHNVEAYFKDLDASEYNFAVKFFEQDWYGVKDPLLKKKLTRNPYNDVHNYKATNPDLAKFLGAIEDDSQELSNDDIKSLIPNW